MIRYWVEQRSAFFYAVLNRPLTHKGRLKGLKLKRQKELNYYAG